jgi:membrane associated rhomboid family serine protease
MRTAPKLTGIPRYPVVAGTALLAIGVTIAWWAQVDISALFPSALIRRGQIWRLVTSILPHAGVLHLAFNVYWLWVFGTLIEEIYGHLKTAGLILMLAIGSSALQFAFASGGIGLSGVGYGLFGLLWILSRHDPRFEEAVDRRTVEVFVIWFLFCIVTTVTGVMPVANIAHGAGGVLGILAGFAIARPDQRFRFVVAIGGMVCFSIWAATSGRPIVNLSGDAGQEEARWGYEALVNQRNSEAVRWFRDAVAYQPKRSDFWYDLGIAYQNLNNKAAALASYRKAAEQGNAIAAYFLGSVYETGDLGMSQDDGQALYWYRKAAVGDDADALNNVAWVYATSRNPAIRNPAAALEYARKAVSLGKDRPNANHLDTLAEAYYVNGEYEDAVKTEQQAIAVASADSKVNFQSSLRKYQLAMKGRQVKGEDTKRDRAQ